MEALFLTRTRYLNGLICPKMLWLRVNRREAFGDAAISVQSVENSKNVQMLARQLFDPVKVIEHGEYAVMEEVTKKAFSELRSLYTEGSLLPALAHAAVSFQNCHCLVDLVALRPDGGAELYMVKAASHISAAVREDLSYQYYVLRMAGFPVKKAAVLYVNRDYELQEEIEPGKLFREMDLTGEMKKRMPAVRDTIAKLRIYMTQEREPGRRLSEGCFSPYDCSCFGFCGKDLPSPNVFQLAGTKLEDKIRFYNQGRVGFEELSGSPGLSATAALQIRCELEKGPLQADRDAIREFLRSLWKPLYFLDFEAFQPVVPKYAGTKPFETIVFQYSVHGEEENELLHREFLGNPASDPRRELAENLVRDIPGNACILAFNASYEKKRIAELAVRFPELEEPLMRLHAHIVDLMPLFQKKQVYDRRMQGSYSLKAVLPALFPEDSSLDYRNLSGVNSGGEAADAFQELLRLEGGKKEALRAEMLRYCELDTYAMVKIVEKLRELLREEDEGEKR